MCEGAEEAWGSGKFLDEDLESMVLQALSYRIGHRLAEDNETQNVRWRTIRRKRARMGLVNFQDVGQRKLSRGFEQSWYVQRLGQQLRRNDFFTSFL